MKAALLLAMALMGCMAPRPPVLETVRDCVVGGEPETVEDWRELVLDCTEGE